MQSTVMEVDRKPSIVLNPLVLGPNTKLSQSALGMTPGLPEAVNSGARSTE